MASGRIDFLWLCGPRGSCGFQRLRPCREQIEEHGFDGRFDCGTEICWGRSASKTLSLRHAAVEAQPDNQHAGDRRRGRSLCTDLFCGRVIHENAKVGTVAPASFVTR